MDNFCSNYGLKGQIKVTEISSTAIRLTFKASTGTIYGDILDYLSERYHQYLEAHPGFMPEPIGLFEADFVSMDVGEKDLKHWAYFLRHALYFAQYHFKETYRTKHGLVCDIALLPVGERTEIFVRNISDVKISESVQDELRVYYRDYINKGFKEEWDGHDIFYDRLILKFNNADVPAAIRKIKRCLASVIQQEVVCK